MDQHQWDFQEKTELTSEVDWEAFQKELSKRFIKAQDGLDVLRWGYTTIVSFNIKEAYNIMITHRAAEDDIWKKIWVVNLWPKVSLFVWLDVWGRILTSENLRKQLVQGPSQCCLCY